VSRGQPVSLFKAAIALQCTEIYGVDIAKSLREAELYIYDRGKIKKFNRGVPMVHILTWAR
jgi:hypothetical protein